MTGFEIYPMLHRKAPLKRLPNVCILRMKPLNHISYHASASDEYRFIKRTPVPKEFKADAEKVGGACKNIHSKQFVICHSFLQKVQIGFCYRHPSYGQDDVEDDAKGEVRTASFNIEFCNHTERQIGVFQLLSVCCIRWGSYS